MKQTDKMNSIKRLLIRSTSMNAIVRSNGIKRINRIRGLNRLSVSSYFSANEMKLDTKLNKKDNIDIFGSCSCGRDIFQQWTSSHPVYILGNKICEHCGCGCIEYVNQQYGDKELGPCCNQYCPTNKHTNKSFFDHNHHNHDHQMCN